MYVIHVYKLLYRIQTEYKNIIARCFIFIVVGQDFIETKSQDSSQSNTAVMVHVCEAVYHI